MTPVCASQGLLLLCLLAATTPSALSDRRPWFSHVHQHRRTVKYGGNVNLTCEATGDPSPHTIQWRRISPYRRNTTKGEMTTLPPNSIRSVLVLTDVRMNETYNCWAESRAGRSTSRRFEVVIGKVVNDCDRDVDACAKKLPMMLAMKRPKPGEMQKYCDYINKAVTCLEDVKARCPALDMTLPYTLKRACSSIRDVNCQFERVIKCNTEAELPMGSSPSDEALRTNKDGICRKVHMVKACVQNFKEECAGKLGGNKYMIEQLEGIFAANAEKCPTTTTESPLHLYAVKSPAKPIPPWSLPGSVPLYAISFPDPIPNKPMFLWDLEDTYTVSPGGRVTLFCSVVSADRLAINCDRVRVPMDLIQKIEHTDPASGMKLIYGAYQLNARNITNDDYYCQCIGWYIKRIGGWGKVPGKRAKFIMDAGQRVEPEAEPEAEGEPEGEPESEAASANNDQAVVDCGSDFDACVMKLPIKKRTTLKQMKQRCGKINKAITCLDDVKARCPEVDITIADQLRPICIGDENCRFERVVKCMVKAEMPNGISPSDEALRINKDGICRKVHKVKACVQKHVQECAGNQEFEKHRALIEKMQGQIAAYAEKCFTWRSTPRWQRWDGTTTPRPRNSWWGGSTTPRPRYYRWHGSTTPRPRNYYFTTSRPMYSGWDGSSTPRPRNSGWGGIWDDFSTIRYYKLSDNCVSRAKNCWEMEEKGTRKYRRTYPNPTTAQMCGVYLIVWDCFDNVFTSGCPNLYKSSTDLREIRKGLNKQCSGPNAWRSTLKPWNSGWDGTTTPRQNSWWGGSTTPRPRYSGWDGSSTPRPRPRYSGWDGSTPSMWDDYSTIRYKLSDNCESRAKSCWEMVERMRQTYPSPTLAQVCPGYLVVMNCFDNVFTSGCPNLYKSSTDLREMRQWVNKQCANDKALVGHLLKSRTDHPEVYSFPSIKAINVTVDFSLVNIMNVRKKTGEVELSAWTTLTWTDWSLSWIPKKFMPYQPEGRYDGIDSRTLPTNLIWTPDIVPFRLTRPAELISPDTAIVSSNGRVTMVHAQQLSIMCNVKNVKTGSTCTIKLGSWTHHDHQINLVLPERGQIDMSNYFAGSSFKVTSTSMKRVVDVYPCCPEQYISVEATFTFKAL